jgi:fatty acid desaturase
MENQNQNPVQNQYQNQNYTTNYVAPKNLSTVSIGDWIITYILMAIPLVNIIMLFVWAFGSNTPESKANWAKASLIIYLITIILVICFWGSIVAMAVGATAFGQ